MGYDEHGPIFSATNQICESGTNQRIARHFLIVWQWLPCYLLSPLILARKGWLDFVEYKQHSRVRSTLWSQRSINVRSGFSRGRRIVFIDCASLYAFLPPGLYWKELKRTGLDWIVTPSTIVIEAKSDIMRRKDVMSKIFLAIENGTIERYNAVQSVLEPAAVVCVYSMICLFVCLFVGGCMDGAVWRPNIPPKYSFSSDEDSNLGHLQNTLVLWE